MSDEQAATTACEDEIIQRVPGVLGGKPMIRQTRISVEVVLDSLAAGQSVDGILERYPFLTRQDISAAIRYAARHLPGTRQLIETTT